jgi:hypothetical protein
MRFMIASFAALAALGATTPAAVQAQQVNVDIGFRQGPVAGRVIIGDADPYHVRYGYYDAPRVIVVERFHRGYGWWRNHGYRRMVLWYDGRDRFYDRYDGRYRGLRQMEVYERDGRYYMPYRDGWRRHDRDDDYRNDGYRNDGYRNDGDRNDRYRNDYESRVRRDRDRRDQDRD